MIKNNSSHSMVNSKMMKRTFFVPIINKLVYVQLWFKFSENKIEFFYSWKAELQNLRSLAIVWWDTMGTVRTVQPGSPSTRLAQQMPPWWELTRIIHSLDLKSPVICKSIVASLYTFVWIVFENIHVSFILTVTVICSFTSVLYWL